MDAADHGDGAAEEAVEEAEAEADALLDREYDNKPWNAEREARLLLAAELYPPAGPLAALNLLNIRASCNAEARDGERLLTADEVKQRVALFWGKGDDSEAGSDASSEQATAARGTNCFALPAELWELEARLYPPRYYVTAGVPLTARRRVPCPRWSFADTKTEQQQQKQQQRQSSIEGGAEETGEHKEEESSQESAFSLPPPQEEGEGEGEGEAGAEEEGEPEEEALEDPLFSDSPSSSFFSSSLSSSSWSSSSSFSSSSPTSPG